MASIYGRFGMSALLLFFHFVFLSVLTTVVVAQFERCSSGETCSDPALECRAVPRPGSDEFTLCEDSDNVCICAPETVNSLQQCSSGDDCGESQRCGQYAQDQPSYCVGCRGVVVSVIPPNNCPGPTLRPSPSPSSSAVVEDGPTRTPAPSISTIASFTPVSIPSTPAPVGPEMPSTSPEVGDDIGDDDEEEEEDMETPSPVPDVSSSPTVSSSPSVSSTITATPSVSLSFGVTPSTTPTTSVSASITPSVSTSPVEDEEILPAGEEETPVLDEDEEVPIDIDGDSDIDIDGESTPEPICIDASALGHLPAHSLVFSSHRRAAVLCDASGSCATPGHMVQFNGLPMMMRTYCDLVHTCTRSVRLVNSPKFSRGLRIPARTEGLSYLAFAARYESKVEEHVLKALVRAGL